MIISGEGVLLGITIFIAIWLFGIAAIRAFATRKKNRKEKAITMEHNRVLFTAGYGNDLPVVFISRLQAAGANLILDVRRPDSKSWNPSYLASYGSTGRLVHQARPMMSYWLLSFRSSQLHFGKPRSMSMEQYKAKIALPPYRVILENLAAFVAGNHLIPCIICAERDHTMCHRTVFADEFLKHLNAEDETGTWSIKHI